MHTHHQIHIYDLSPQLSIWAREQIFTLYIFERVGVLFPIVCVCHRQFRNGKEYSYLFNLDELFATIDVETLTDIAVMKIITTHLNESFFRYTCILSVYVC